ncbi:hypothetical protein WMY93_025836 [Mugilogobius chulae]|uniref:C-type lectin domain-containing protein n=1 Tax=Mugilogobius chulae TaxID=88201 RepID=A0AAW0N010_9GOBI
MMHLKCFRAGHVVTQETIRKLQYLDPHERITFTINQNQGPMAGTGTSEMDTYLAALLLTFGSVLVSCSRYPFRHYHYIDTAMTWPEAQQYCRKHHSDLATFESMEEIQQLQPTISYSWVWIGLIDDPPSWKQTSAKDPNSWRWSATGETSQSGYQVWSTGGPDYYDLSETCVMIDTGGNWQDYNCNTLLGFVCFTESSQSQVTYTYISTQKTWSDAQAYCRQHHTDLAVIESYLQNTYVYNSITPRVPAWFGLYRVPWTWSDQSLSTFRNWRQGSPNNPAAQHCVAENPDHLWDDDYCNYSYKVLCQTVTKLQTSVRGILQTGADLTLPEINAQILQKVEAELRRRGWTDFRLSWRIKPVKQTMKHTAPSQCGAV